MDHAKTRIRINKNVGGDALDRPLQPIEKTKEPVQKDGGAASQIFTGDLILTNYFGVIFALRCLS